MEEHSKTNAINSYENKTESITKTPANSIECFNSVDNDSNLWTKFSMANLEQVTKLFRNPLGQSIYFNNVPIVRNTYELDICEYPPERFMSKCPSNSYKLSDDDNLVMTTINPIQEHPFNNRECHNGFLNSPNRIILLQKKTDSSFQFEKYANKAHITQLEEASNNDTPQKVKMTETSSSPDGGELNDQLEMDISKETEAASYKMINNGLLCSSSSSFLEHNNSINENNISGTVKISNANCLTCSKNSEDNTKNEHYYDSDVITPNEILGETNGPVQLLNSESIINGSDITSPSNMVQKAKDEKMEKDAGVSAKLVELIFGKSNQNSDYVEDVINDNATNNLKSLCHILKNIATFPGLTEDSFKNCSMNLEKKGCKVTFSLTFNITDETTKENQTSENEKDCPIIMEEQNNSTVLENVQSTQLLELPSISSEIGIHRSIMNTNNENSGNTDTNNTNYTPYIPTDFKDESHVLHKEPINAINNNQQNCTITSSLLPITDDQKNGTIDTQKYDEKSNKMESSICLYDNIVEQCLSLINSNLSNTILSSQQNIISESNTKNFARNCNKNNEYKSINNNSSVNSLLVPVPIHGPSNLPTTVKNVSSTSVKKRPLSDVNENIRPSKKQKPTEILKTTKPKTRDEVINAFIDENETADNNDPRWKLYNFSDLQKGFNAVVNQWSCYIVPNLHENLTKRHYNSSMPFSPVSSTIKIPGNKSDKYIKATSVYHDQIAKIDCEIARLRQTYDCAPFLTQRKSNKIWKEMEELRDRRLKLNNALGEVIHFYTYYCKDNNAKWDYLYMTPYHKNEVFHYLNILSAFDQFYETPS